MTKVDSQSQFFDQNSSVAKLLFLAVLSIALCSLGPMSLFAPVPLTIAFLLYGRRVTFGVAAISTGLVWALSVAMKDHTFYLVGMYAVALLFAFLASEVIYRNVNPVKGLIYAGLVLVILGGSSLIAFDKMSSITLKGAIGNQVSQFLMQIKQQTKQQPVADVSGEEQRAFEDFVNKPEALTNEIYSALPVFVFAISYFGLWISLYVTLRNSMVWRYKVLYNYALRDLTNFKVPDFFVYPLIASLVLMLGVDYGLPKESELIGRNLLYCLGIFYLFQGFGVYNDFLKYLKIGGFIKTLFLAFTLILGSKFLAILGLFDLWFNFRRFFTNRKKDEGDTI